MSSQTHAPQDADLAAFFTGFDLLRETFAKFVASPELPKRLFIIHGVGGAGKSSLLRMFRLHCKSIRTPVALVSGDESKSAVEVLSRWRDGLQADGIKLPNFDKTLGNYARIQARVDQEARSSQTEERKLADLAGKAASKTAESVAGAAAGAALGSIIPGVGTVAGGVIGGVIGGTSAEALIDWLRRFLSKPEIDLLIDPSKRLTEDFHADIAASAQKQRIVLIIDTFEQMPGLANWICGLAQKLHLNENVLLVIAGRAMPDWDREWPGWFAQAYSEELRPMTNDMMRQLIRRYYHHIRDSQPDPEQVEEIVRFARGLPLAATSAVQLWVRYGVKDFVEVKSQVEASLVRRLREGVPKELLPMLNAASAVRYFNKPILRAVMSQDDVNDIYEELLTFPFVRPRTGGFMLHDVVREILDENLQTQDPEQHREIHQRAAEYFDQHISNAHIDQAEQLGRERLYHMIRADEVSGIAAFVELSESFARYRAVRNLRDSLNDVNSIPVKRENSRLWLHYYSARLAHLETGFEDAARIYEAISKNESAEFRLKAYALCDWGTILQRTRYLSQSGGRELALTVIAQSQKLMPSGDPKTVINFLNLGGVSRRLGNYDRAVSHYQEAMQWAEEHGDWYGIVDTLGLLAENSFSKGDWRKLLEYRAERMRLVSSRPSAPVSLMASTQSWWFTPELGRYFEAEGYYRKQIAIAKESGEADYYYFGVVRDLGVVLALQGKSHGVDKIFQEAIALTKHRQADNEYEEGKAYNDWGYALLQQGDLDRAESAFRKDREIREPRGYKPWMSETYVRLGLLYELRRDWSNARYWWNEILVGKSKEGFHIERFHMKCGALSGLARVSRRLSERNIAESLVEEAEDIATQYEYNDHLASLSLTRGNLAWDDGRVESLDYFKRSLIFALRFNRFLLDEVLSGRPHGSSLQPIVATASLPMLHALRGWWQTEVNDIGTPRPDTISLIPEGIPLIEAERIAREREPGDGSQQKTVIEQIESALR